jgi:pilus assembly protein CpaE
MDAVEIVTSPLESPRPIERAPRPPARRAHLIAFMLDRHGELSLNACLSQLSIANAKVKRGGITNAIEYLSVERSPQTIVVDISGIEMPASRMHQLAELCEPGVTVVAIGDRNDVGLYRDLKLAGVSEYIVKPITTQLLAGVLAPAPAAAASPIHRKLGKLVAVVGARGGVGVTMLATHLAWYLANRQSRRVMLLDLDLQTGDCALALNLKPTSGLREALANPLRIDGVFLERTVAIHGERLFVLSAEEPLDADAEFTPEAVDRLIGTLRTQFHYVIADVPRLSAAPYRQALDIADLRVIVADQTLRSARDAVRLRNALGAGGEAHRNLLVVNRSGEGGRHAMTLEEMAKANLHADFVIPFRPRLFSIPGIVRHGAVIDRVAMVAAQISGRRPERKQWWRLVR